MRKLPKILSNEETNILYKYYSKTKRNQANSRDYAMYLLMLEYGLRVSEVANARREDLDVQSGRLKVQGKGKKDRILYIQPQHLKSLKIWLDQRPTSDWLFCAIFSSRGTSGRQLDPRQIREKLYRIGKKTGISGLHPHRLRHTFATRLYEHTRDLAIVQEVLGHDNISTTRIYTHISGANIRDALQNFHGKKQHIKVDKS